MTADNTQIPPLNPLTMEEKIKLCRAALQDDPINARVFQRRYRPDLDRMQSALIVWGDETCALRRFTVAARVWELVEFLISDKTDLALVINFQTQQILEYSRYLDAEVTMVDQIQDALDKLGKV